MRLDFGFVLTSQNPADTPVTGDAQAGPYPCAALDTITPTHQRGITAHHPSTPPCHATPSSRHASPRHVTIMPSSRHHDATSHNVHHATAFQPMPRHATQSTTPHGTTRDHAPHSLTSPRHPSTPSPTTHTARTDDTHISADAVHVQRSASSTGLNFKDTYATLFELSCAQAFLTIGRGRCEGSLSSFCCHGH